MKFSIAKKSKLVARKWLNLKSKADEFYADDIFEGRLLRKTEYGTPVRVEPYASQGTGLQNISYDNFIFVGTWNLGGITPHNELNLDDWLNASCPADIYVLGFQEIVPLNAGNIFGVEDSGPATKWLALIRQTLNSSSFSTFSLDGPKETSESNYCLVASKQMVGMFLCVWVRSDLRQHVRDLKVSCVGRGLMGYLGKKGSISISMSFQGTSFCFVCSHLTSGEKGCDMIRRNYDVMEILKRTHFPQMDKILGKKTSESILEHDRVIWLGDLNYRLALLFCNTKILVERNDWEALLEKDQLLIEKKTGHIFEGWNEGNIYFPPTYKYCRNSDHYAGENIVSRTKGRTPAWCDRILWYGKGLRQLCYVCGESKFSDHRPVYSIFMAEIKLPSESSFRALS
ncbi:type IV inositol polyphosphate 5-phosphatase 6-like, partial [Cryptomeria japonica]|uniref:type IV inositol polyphosphate 5-phosphatase 6-like n=1 Tax=Cryptomeria japonica TaxID=3369 RepID=UPI0027D9D1D7